MCPRRSNSWKSAPVPGRRPCSWSSTLGALDADPHTIESPPKCTVLAESRVAMSNAPGAIATKCSTTAGSNRTLPVSRSTAQPLASKRVPRRLGVEGQPDLRQDPHREAVHSWVCSSPSTVDGANLRSSAGRAPGAPPPVALPLPYAVRLCGPCTRTVALARRDHQELR